MWHFQRHKYIIWIKYLVWRWGVSKKDNKDEIKQSSQLWERAEYTDYIFAEM